MVTSWLWNSISNEIVEGFVYVTSSRELWLEIEARYERSSGPMIYQIQREISTISQGDMTLTCYLTRVKKMWNELSCLAPSPKCTCGGCTCGINKAIGERHTTTQLMQFLMGLHENFDKEKSQLLMIDPLPDIERAFSMLFAVEQQRSVQVQLADCTNNAAYQFYLKENKKDSLNKQSQKRRPFLDKRSMMCTHCHKSGHLRDTCFQLHGTPERYKALNDKKKQYGTNYNLVANIETKRAGTGEVSTSNSEPKAEVADLVAELLKLMRSKEPPSDPISNYANYVNYEEQFAGNASCSSALNLGEWIIDTGATNHVCAHLSYFVSYSVPSHTQVIHLPDGTIKTVTYIGTVKITDTLVLSSVLYIPDFSVNLICVSQLCKNSSYSFSFTYSSCILQDQVSKEVVAKGILTRNLYIVQSPICKALAHSTVPTPISFSAITDCNSSLWHKRMGHAPMIAIKHIPDCKFVDDSFETKCNICPKAKQSRVSFEPSNSHTVSPFSLIHLDLWGPYKTPSISVTIGASNDPTNSLEHSSINSHPPPAVTFPNSPADITPTVPHFSPTDVPPATSQLPRRSARVSHKPTWLDDFICQHDSSILHSNSNAYTSFVASLSVLQEPRSFVEAMQYPEWRAAMDDEIKALESNQTWTLTPLPPGKRAIGSKWVFKVKLRADGSIERYKARLVAKGFNQIEGVDYTESFSPVAKAVIVRLFLSLAAANGWALHQLDVNNAFLHGFLDEEIYMVPPAGSVQIKTFFVRPEAGFALVERRIDT
ncbi:uncharacterized protein LOC105164425 [Sesamum indicum]|uniref:Uncharacterized protein LOC105164425 n=1 Tax=Sesamum indicum TaxID=4182 RepID=A0A6I9TKF2_SESIN|nr:uncharacterized protein LOC105164425 [Sesamum indicum]